VDSLITASIVGVPMMIVVVIVLLFSGEKKKTKKIDTNIVRQKDIYSQGDL
jgi:hypothetical protein